MVFATYLMTKRMTNIISLNGTQICNFKRKTGNRKTPFNFRQKHFVSGELADIHKTILARKYGSIAISVRPELKISGSFSTCFRQVPILSEEETKIRCLFPPAPNALLGCIFFLLLLLSSLYAR